MLYPPLKAEYIAQYLRTPNLTLDVRPTLSSTNTVLRQLAEQGAPVGLVLVAEEQTGGRGRFGRSFYSPKESGVYFSVLLKPDLPLKDNHLITTAAAVAICRALEQVFNLAPQIKWVNDVYLHRQKTAGILTEGIPAPSGDRLAYALLGIGINIFPPADAFNGELAAKATSLFPTPPADDLRAVIVAAVLDNYFQLAPHLQEQFFYQEYKKRLFILGEDIFIKQGNESFQARVLDLREDFALKVQLACGEIRYLNSGEVSIIPQIKNP